MIEFTPEEEQLMARLSVVGGWEDKDAAPLKAKIRPFLLTRTAHCCCYCRLSMHQGHPLTIDTEHVLPKGNGKFPQFTFEMRNLSISCKRCNMGIKGADTSFYLGAPQEADPFKSEYYQFIHPNLDVADNHLSVFFFQHNAKVIVKYRIAEGSAKGSATYEYFELQNLEINTFNEAQGLAEVLPSEALPPAVAQELNTFLDSI